VTVNEDSSIRVALHAGQLLQPVPGGIGRYEIEVLRRLPRFGIDAVAFAAGARPRGVPARIPWIDLGPPHGPVRYELWHRFGLPRVRIEADLVHAPSLAVPAVRGRPLVVTVHDVAFLRLPETSTRHGVRFHARGLEIARRHADVIIVNSAFTGRELEALGFASDRIEVVPFGVDPPAPRDPDEIDRAVARAGVERPYVLTVGTIEPRKDIPTIARAVERLRATHPDLTLVVAGPKGWGEVTGLDRPFVRVIGAQPWSALDALYRRADAFCLASLYEGFGLPVAEALARGVPTVTTTGSAIDEVLGGAGAQFVPGDAATCAEELARVLDDPALRLERARAGVARASELSWDRCTETHAEIYRRTVTRSAS
jgi:glycosyltransferase involved in cell wall biosynthesis